MIEEEIFYPAFEDKIEDEAMQDEAYVEHDGAKVLISEIMTSPDDKYFDAKVTVLSEMIKHHVKEEEKRPEGLLAQARAAGLDMDVSVSVLWRARNSRAVRRRPVAAGQHPQLHRT